MHPFSAVWGPRSTGFFKYNWTRAFGRSMDALWNGISIFRLVKIAKRRPLQAWVDGLALQRQDAKYAFMHTIKRFSPHKTFECFYAQGELTQRQRSFRI